MEKDPDGIRPGSVTVSICGVRPQAMRTARPESNGPFDFWEKTLQFQLNTFLRGAGHIQASPPCHPI